MGWRDFNYTKWMDENKQFDHATYDAAIESAIKSATDISDLIKHLEEAPPRPPWRPNASIEHDSIHVYLENVATYAVWLTPQISVLCSMETDEIVGMTISGVTRLIKECDEIAAKYNE